MSITNLQNLQTLNKGESIYLYIKKGLHKGSPVLFINFIYFLMISLIIFSIVEVFTFNK
ncbi:hypothetical protein HNP69_002758 [Chryseobacterium koreense]|nr:hypothetical protein [Chryseobacterium koreense]